MASVFIRMINQFQPTAKQREFLTNPAQIRLFLAGFGTGKTTVNVIETFYQMMVVHPGYTGLVCTPTYKHLLQGFLETWKKLIPQEYWSMNIGNQTIFLNNGSKIFLRHAGDGGLNLAGINAAFVSIDEAALIDDPDAFKQALSRLREGAPGKPLRAILTTTPNGFNWIPDEFGFSPDNNKWIGNEGCWTDVAGLRSTIRAKTTDNEHLPPSYIQNLLNNPPAWVSQYVNAEYTKAEGMVFGEFSHAINVVPPTVLPIKYKNIAVGIDWGYAANGSAIVLGETPAGNLVVLEEHSHKNMLVDKTGWFRIFDDIEAKYRVDAWFCDPAMPAYIESLRVHFRQKELVYSANNKRVAGMQVVKSLFHSKKLFILEDCTVLIDEIGRLKYKTDSEDSVKKDDHCIDAMRYAVMGITEVFDRGRWSNR